MKGLQVILLMVLCSGLSHAQGFSVSLVPSQHFVSAPLPKTVEPYKPFNVNDSFLYGAVAFSQVAYARSLNPPSTSRGVGIAAGEIGISVLLHKTGHAKIARWADTISACAFGGLALHNSGVGSIGR